MARHCDGDYEDTLGLRDDEKDHENMSAAGSARTCQQEIRGLQSKGCGACLLLLEGVVEGQEGRLQRSLRTVPVPLPLQEARKVLRCKLRCLSPSVAIEYSCTCLFNFKERDSTFLDILDQTRYGRPAAMFC